jgi:hypothetical protein
LEIIIQGGAGRPMPAVLEQDADQQVPPLFFPAILHQKHAKAVTRLRLVGRGLDLAAQLDEPALPDF